MRVVNGGHVAVLLAPHEVAAELEERPWINLPSLGVVVQRHTLQTERQPAAFTGALQHKLEPF
jgi:hypothetical protein